jgi:hypothetical protein
MVRDLAAGELRRPRGGQGAHRRSGLTSMTAAR